MNGERGRGEEGGGEETTNQTTNLTIKHNSTGKIEEPIEVSVVRDGHSVPAHQVRNVH